MSIYTSSRDMIALEPAAGCELYRQERRSLHLPGKRGLQGHNSLEEEPQT
jgi:hypothetical protein